jgi:hypothetical protein
VPETVFAVANAVESLVAGGPVPGARLAVELRERVPGWSPTEYGVRSLREFIATHVPNVTVVGRTGMDVLYGPTGSAEGVAGPTEQVDYWRIWVSPHSPLAIAVARHHLSLRAVGRSMPVEPDEVLLSPPGPEVHRAMAGSFLPEVAEEIRPALQAVLDSESDQWWQAWNRALRDEGLAEVWGKFRVSSFQGLLDDAVKSAGFDQPAASQIAAAIRRRRPTLRGPQQNGKVNPDLGAIVDRAQLLEVVTGALQHLTTAELRELRLPVGAIVDALSHRAHR